MLVMQIYKERYIYFSQMLSFVLYRVIILPSITNPIVQSDAKETESSGVRQTLKFIIDRQNPV